MVKVLQTCCSKVCQQDHPQPNDHKHEAYAAVLGFFLKCECKVGRGGSVGNLEIFVYPVKCVVQGWKLLLMFCITEKSLLFV